MPLKSRLSVLLAVAVLPLAGCGDSGSGSGDLGADPAKVVPADAPLYVEAVVRPDGDLKDDASDALKKLLNTDDPGAKINELMDEISADSDVKWDEVKQWLGPRVGIYLTKFDGEDSVAALIANVTDEEKAKATLAKVGNESDGEAVGEIIGDYAVIGTTEGVAAVKATDGGKGSLAEDPDFVGARDAAAADDSLLFVYAEPQKLLDAFAAMADSSDPDNPFGNPQALGVFRQLLAKAGRSVSLSLHANGDAVRLDAAAIGAPAGSAPTAAADSLAALPADAWLAIGFGDIGKTLTDAMRQLTELAAVANPDGPDFEQLLGTIEQRIGIDIQRDFLSWMGDGAVYARGRNLADIGGALTIKSKDAAKSRKAVGILAQGLAKAGANVKPAKIEGYDVAVEVRSAQAPISVFIAANADRFTIGVNPKAMSDVLDPDETLGDSETYDNAVEALGDDIKPIVIIDTQTVITLIESFGATQAEGYAKVKPYLDALGPISIGTARDGDVSRFAFALGLR